MFQPEAYLEELTGRLRRVFGARLRYVGLQGSYLRGEARESSDIDIMAVIDGLRPADLAAYRREIEQMDRPEKSCGFLCGTEDLAGWNALEACHVLHATRDYYGRLAGLLPRWDREDVAQYVRLSVNNLYHEIVHRAVHAPPERGPVKLAASWRGTFFILQNLCWLERGQFPETKAAALELLSGRDRAVLERLLALDAGGEISFQEDFALLFDWCQEVLARLNA